MTKKRKAKAESETIGNESPVQETAEEELTETTPEPPDSSDELTESAPEPPDSSDESTESAPETPDSGDESTESAPETPDSGDESDESAPKTPDSDGESDESAPPETASAEKVTSMFNRCPRCKHMNSDRARVLNKFPTQLYNGVQDGKPYSRIERTRIMCEKCKQIHIVRKYVCIEKQD